MSLRYAIHLGHKVGIVLYTLGNIHPKYRSRLKILNLVMIATVPVIEKYSLDEVLKPFIKDLNLLCTEGVTVSSNGLSRTYKGALLTFLADNLAANDLGGFKRSFSFSFRCCRDEHSIEEELKRVAPELSSDATIIISTYMDKKRWYHI